MIIHLCYSSIPLHHNYLGPDVILYALPFAVHLMMMMMMIMIMMVFL